MFLNSQLLIDLQAHVVDERIREADEFRLARSVAGERTGRWPRVIGRHRARRISLAA